MQVQQVLKSKSTDGVFTVLPNTKVSEAAKILSDKGIGTVLISQDGHSPDGILSERDIVRELSRSGSGCLTQTVDQYMTRKLVTCSPTSNTREVLNQMTEGRFRHMPVLEDGKLVGVISLGDVVKAQMAKLAMEKDALEGMIMGH